MPEATPGSTSSHSVCATPPRAGIVFSFRSTREKNPIVLNNLATLRGIQGRWDESTALRQEVLRLEPLHAVYYTNLAQNLIHADRLDEADAALRKSLELQPSVATAHLLLGIIAVLRGDLDAALREAELEPTGWRRDSVVALVRFARGEREQADQALQQLIANVMSKAKARTETSTIIDTQECN